MMFIKLCRPLIYEKCRAWAKSLSYHFLLVFEYIQSKCNFKQNTFTYGNKNHNFGVASAIVRETNPFNVWSLKQMR